MTRIRAEFGDTYTELGIQIRMFFNYECASPEPTFLRCLILFRAKKAAASNPFNYEYIFKSDGVDNKVCVTQIGIDDEKVNLLSYLFSNYVLLHLIFNSEPTHRFIHYVITILYKRVSVDAKSL